MLLLAIAAAHACEPPVDVDPAFGPGVEVLAYCVDALTFHEGPGGTLRELADAAARDWEAMAPCGGVGFVNVGDCRDFPNLEPDLRIEVEELDGMLAGEYSFSIPDGPTVQMILVLDPTWVTTPNGIALGRCERELDGQTLVAHFLGHALGLPNACGAGPCTDENEAAALMSVGLGPCEVRRPGPVEERLLVARDGPRLFASCLPTDDPLATGPGGTLRCAASTPGFDDVDVTWRAGRASSSGHLVELPVFEPGREPIEVCASGWSEACGEVEVCTCAGETPQVCARPEASFTVVVEPDGTPVVDHLTPLVDPACGPRVQWALGRPGESPRVIDEHWEPTLPSLGPGRWRLVLTVESLGGTGSATVDLGGPPPACSGCSGSPSRGSFGGVAVLALVAARRRRLAVASGLPSRAAGV